MPANQGSGANTRTTKFNYDDPGRLEEYLGDINSSTQQVRVRYECDGSSDLRKLVRLTNATEKITAYDYDELDRTISVKDRAAPAATVARPSSSTPPSAPSSRSPAPGRAAHPPLGWKRRSSTMINSDAWCASIRAWMPAMPRLMRTTGAGSKLA